MKPVGNTASVAVKPCRKLRPPTGPISPGGEEAGRRRAAELALDRLGVVVGDAEHRAAAAVAGEHERARRPLAGEGLDPELERLAKVLVGRARVARVQAHDLPRRDLGADDERARLAGSAPSTPRTRKSPCSYSGLPPSITTPISNPPATSPRSRGDSSEMICSTV